MGRMEAFFRSDKQQDNSDLDPSFELLVAVTSDSAQRGLELWVGGQRKWRQSSSWDCTLPAFEVPLAVFTSRLAFRYEISDLFLTTTCYKFTGSSWPPARKLSSARYRRMVGHSSALHFCGIPSFKGGSTLVEVDAWKVRNSGIVEQQCNWTVKLTSEMYFVSFSMQKPLGFLTASMDYRAWGSAL